MTSVRAARDRLAVAARRVARTARRNDAQMIQTHE
jgi:hypothetical protein